MDNINYLLNSNLSNVVIEYITKKIFIGEYKAGDKIVEIKIAEDLKISRSPIREAIKVIQEQGLIEYIPRKGCTVAFKSEEQIKEIFDIRCLLENNIIETLIKEDILINEDFNSLSKIVDQMDVIAHSNEDITKLVYDMSKEDIKFHKYLWEKSNKTLHIKILNDIFLNLQLAMILDTNIDANLKDTASEHALIIDSLKNKDIESTKKNLRDHIVSYRGMRFLSKDISN